MRGKNIMWLSLIAILLSVTMVNIVTAPVPPTKLYVDPSIIKGQPPGEFEICIKVDKATDVYAFGMTVDFAPYVSVLVVSKVTEGPFLKQGGITYFRYTYNAFKGEVKVGCTLLGTVPGVSGDGTLFCMKFIIVEAGSSAINLANVKVLDSNLNPIHPTIRHGSYQGPEMAVKMMELVSGRHLTVGDTQVFRTKIKNHDYHKTMCAKVKIDIVRQDGRRTGFWAGQSYVTTPRAPVYLYVNEYNEWQEWDWTNPGASVIGPPDGNYTESTVNGARSSSYGFDDLTMNPSDVIGNVKLEGYCQYPNGATEDVDIDVYTTSPTIFNWLGSLYGSPDWSWVGPRWIGDDVTDVLPQLKGSDATPLNNLEVLLYNYHGDTDNPMRVDALRLKVGFSQVDPAGAPEYCVGPQEELELDLAQWALAAEDVGRYYVSATVYYTYAYSSWIRGSKVVTRWFEVSA